MCSNLDIFLINLYKQLKNKALEVFSSHKSPQPCKTKQSDLKWFESNSKSSKRIAGQLNEDQMVSIDINIKRISVCHKTHAYAVNNDANKVE